MKKGKKKTVRNRRGGTIVVIRRKALLILGMLLIALVAIFHDPKFAPCANSISCIKDLSGTFDKNASTGTFHGKSSIAPTERKIGFGKKTVLGDTSAQKHIAIDLTTQRIFAYEGDRVVYEFPVSTGKWYPTPTGTFRIWIKLRYTRMSGGDQALGTYYNLPNVPYVMFFYNDAIAKSRGFSLHGTYWHNNFGHPMSHGCVNMRTEDVEKLYYWTTPQVNGNSTYASKDNPGTEIVIYGETPKE